MLAFISYIEVFLADEIRDGVDEQLVVHHAALQMRLSARISITLHTLFNSPCRIHDSKAGCRLPLALVRVSFFTEQHDSTLRHVVN